MLVGIIATLLPVVFSQSALPNIFKAFKTVNIFESSPAKIAFVVDGIDPTFNKMCVRPYNGVDVMVPDAFCSHYNIAENTAVHNSFHHARSMSDVFADYSYALEFDMGISMFDTSFNFAGVSFSASEQAKYAFAAFQSASINTYKSTDVTSCYEVVYSDLYPTKPTEELRQRILKYPLTYDAAFYTAEIKKETGTHFIKAALFGGASAQFAVASEQTMAASFSTDQSAQLVAEETLGWVTSTQKNEIHLSVEAETYKKIIGANYNLYITGPQSTTSQPQQYHTDACSDPQPIKLTLEPVVLWLTPENFPEWSPTQLSVVAANMMQGLEDFCTQYTCYTNPKPVPPVWTPAVTVTGVSGRKKLASSSSLCVLTELRKLTYANCELQIGAHETNDTGTYWYLSALGNGAQVCSAMCTENARWQKIDATGNRNYQVSQPGGKDGQKTVDLESSETSFCALNLAHNEFICNDRCRVYSEGGVYKLHVNVGKCYDDKHMKDKDVHICGAYCTDTTRPVTLFTKAVGPNDGVVPLFLANETLCTFSTQQLAGSFLSDIHSGGGCVLKQQTVEGREGVYWTVQAVRPTAEVAQGWCYDKCEVSCTPLA